MHNIVGIGSGRYTEMYHARLIINLQLGAKGFTRTHNCVELGKWSSHFKKYRR